MGLSKPASTVTHALYPVPQHLKAGLTLELLKHTDTRSVLIFARTRHRAARLAQMIDRAGYRVTSLHSDRTQSQRQNAIDGFRSGTYQIMVATDIAARGIDVASISLFLVNDPYSVPPSLLAYLMVILGNGMRYGLRMYGESLAWSFGCALLALVALAGEEHECSEGGDHPLRLGGVHLPDAHRRHLLGPAFWVLQRSDESQGMVPLWPWRD